MWLLLDQVLEVACTEFIKRKRSAEALEKESVEAQLIQMGLVEPGGKAGAMPELVEAIRQLWQTHANPSKQEQWPAVSSWFFDAWQQSLPDLSILQQKGIFGVYLELCTSHEMAVTKQQGDRARLQTTSELRLHFFSVLWRCFHVLENSWQPIWAAFNDPIPTGVDLSIPSVSIDEPGLDREMSASAFETMDDDAFEAFAGDAGEHSPGSQASRASSFADAEEDIIDRVPFPFRVKVDNIIHDATASIVEVIAGDSEALRPGWLEEQLALAINNAVSAVDSLRARFPEMLAQVYPLFGSANSCTGPRRVFRGSMLSAENRLQLEPKHARQLILHQALSVLETSHLVTLLRSVGIAAGRMVQSPIKTITHRVIGTMLAVDLKGSFDGLCDRLLDPIQDCYHVYEQLGNQHHIDYNAWIESAIPAFGSRLHRALRFTDPSVAQYEERIYLMHAVLSMLSTAVPRMSHYNVQRSFKQLTGVLIKSVQPALRLLMIGLDMKEDWSAKIQQHIDSYLSPDFINQNIVRFLHDKLTNEWPATCRCNQEVRELLYQIEMGSESGRNCAEERYQLARVLLTEMCEQAAGGADAMVAPKLVGIILKVHSLLQRPLFLKHTCFTLFDEVLHVLQVASSPALLEAALERDFDAPTEPVVLLDYVSDRVVHSFLQFAVEVLADAEYVDEANQTWGQSGLAHATWAAKYVVPTKMVGELVMQPLRHMADSLVTVDSVSLVKDLLMQASGFCADFGPGTLKDRLRYGLPELEVPQNL